MILQVFDPGYWAWIHRWYGSGHFPTLRSMSEWQPCYDQAESEQHLDDLRLAHASRDETPDGSLISEGSLERMKSSVALWFAQWPTTKQVKFLTDITVVEAALMLEGLDVKLREDLISSVSSGLRRRDISYF